MGFLDSLSEATHTIKLNIIPGGALLPRDVQSGKFLQDENGIVRFNNSEKMYKLVEYHWDGPRYETKTKQKVKGRKRGLFGALTGAAIGGAIGGGLGAFGGAMAGGQATGGTYLETKQKDVEVPTAAELHIMSVDDEDGIPEIHKIRFMCTTSLDSKIRRLIFFN